MDDQGSSLRWGKSMTIAERQLNRSGDSTWIDYELCHQMTCWAATGDQLSRGQT